MLYLCSAFAKIIPHYFRFETYLFLSSSRFWGFCVSVIISTFDLYARCLYASYVLIFALLFNFWRAVKFLHLNA